MAASRRESTLAGSYRKGVSFDVSYRNHFLCKAFITSNSEQIFISLIEFNNDTLSIFMRVCYFPHILTLQLKQKKYPCPELRGSPLWSRAQFSTILTNPSGNGADPCHWRIQWLWRPWDELWETPDTVTEHTKMQNSSKDNMIFMFEQNLRRVQIMTPETSIVLFLKVLTFSQGSPDRNPHCVKAFDAIIISPTMGRY